MQVQRLLSVHELAHSSKNSKFISWRLTSLMVHLHLYVNKRPIFKQWSLSAHEEKTKTWWCPWSANTSFPFPFPSGFNGDAAVRKKTASLYGFIRVTTTTNRRKQSLFSSVVCDGDMKEQWDVTLCRISYDLLRKWHLLQSPAGQGWEIKDMMSDWSWFWKQQFLQQSYLKVTLEAVLFFCPAVSHSRLSCTKIKKLRSQLLDNNLFWNISCFSCCPYPDRQILESPVQPSLSLNLNFPPRCYRLYL